MFVFVQKLKTRTMAEIGSDTAISIPIALPGVVDDDQIMASDPN